MNRFVLSAVLTTFLVLATTVSAEAQVGVHGGQLYEFANGSQLEVTKSEVYFFSHGRQSLVVQGEAKGVTADENKFEYSFMINGSRMIVLGNGDFYFPGTNTPPTRQQHRVRFRPNQEYPALQVTYNSELKRHMLTLIEDANTRRSIDEGTLRAIQTNFASVEHFPSDKGQPYVASEPNRDRQIPEPKEVVGRLAETAIAIGIEAPFMFPTDYDRENFIVSERGTKTPIFFNVASTDNLQIFPFELKDHTRGWFVSGTMISSKEGQNKPLTVAVRAYDGAFINLLPQETPIRNLAAFGQSAEVLEALSRGFEKYRNDGFNQEPVLKNFRLPSLLGAELPSVRYRNRTTEQTMDARGILQIEGLVHQEILMAEVLYFLDSNGMKEEMRKLEAMEYNEYRELLLMHMYDIIVNNFYTRESRKSALRVLLTEDFGRTLSADRRLCLWLMGDKWKDYP